MLQVLLPGFREWLSRRVMHSLPPAADLVNLAAVRAWGAPVPGSVAKVVSATHTWGPWTTGRAPVHVRNPNILVSGYVVRVSTLPRLLSAFGAADGWRRNCSVDQALGQGSHSARTPH